MSDLITTQRVFGAALRNATKAADASSMFSTDDATTMRRLAIYRGNAVAAASKALANTFPVISQVVGEEFFRALARRYWDDVPSASGDLTEYGAHFANFLAAFEPVAELGYLADLARLEWLVQRALCAHDAPRVAISTLTTLAPTDQEEMRLALLPGTSVLESVWPVARLWAIHQADYNGEFSVDLAQGEIALIARDGWRVTVQSIGRAEYTFYQAIAADLDLGHAIDAALSVDTNWDVAKQLTKILGNGPLELRQQKERITSP